MMVQSAAAMNLASDAMSDAAQRGCAAFAACRCVAAAAAAVLLVASGPSGAVAQTPFSSLTSPNGPQAAPRTAPATKAAPPGHAKSCSNYGAGYVNVPGTDTCVKIGAAVRTDAVVNVGH